MKRSIVFLVLLSLYLLHYDFWFWQRPEIVLGLPIGLLYHLVYCLAISLVLALLIRYATRREQPAR